MPVAVFLKDGFTPQESEILETLQLDLASNRPVALNLKALLDEKLVCVQPELYLKVVQVYGNACSANLKPITDKNLLGKIDQILLKDAQNAYDQIGKEFKGDLNQRIIHRMLLLKTVALLSAVTKGQFAPVNDEIESWGELIPTEALGKLNQDLANDYQVLANNKNIILAKDAKTTTLEAIDNKKKSFRELQKNTIKDELLLGIVSEEMTGPNPEQSAKIKNNLANEFASTKSDEGKKKFLKLEQKYLANATLPASLMPDHWARCMLNVHEEYIRDGLNTQENIEIRSDTFALMNYVYVPKHPDHLAAQLLALTEMVNTLAGHVEEMDANQLVRMLDVANKIQDDFKALVEDPSKLKDEGKAFTKALGVFNNKVAIAVWGLAMKEGGLAYLPSLFKEHPALSLNSNIMAALNKAIAEAFKKEPEKKTGMLLFTQTFNVNAQKPNDKESEVMKLIADLEMIHQLNLLGDKEYRTACRDISGKISNVTLGALEKMPDETAFLIRLNIALKKNPEEAMKMASSRPDLTDPTLVILQYLCERNSPEAENYYNELPKDVRGSPQAIRILLENGQFEVFDKITNDGINHELLKNMDDNLATLYLASLKARVIKPEFNDTYIKSPLYRAQLDLIARLDMRDDPFYMERAKLYEDANKNHGLKDGRDSPGFSPIDEDHDEEATTLSISASPPLEADKLEALTDAFAQDMRVLTKISKKINNGEVIPKTDMEAINKIEASLNELEKSLAPGNRANVQRAFAKMTTSVQKFSEKGLGALRLPVASRKEETYLDKLPQNLNDEDKRQIHVLISEVRNVTREALKTAKIEPDAIGSKERGSF